ncbi:MAG TPA: hypothetical protein VGR37_20105 [Longimicrobiaceae bacterium]|nr:hypothetical protein [Longimicrobiaceae bacterium]
MAIRSESVQSRETVSRGVLRTFWRRNWLLVFIMAALMVGSPFVSFKLEGWEGVYAGWALNLASFIVGAYALTRVECKDLAG